MYNKAVQMKWQRGDKAYFLNLARESADLLILDRIYSDKHGYALLSFIGDRSGLVYNLFACDQRLIRLCK